MDLRGNEKISPGCDVSDLLGEIGALKAVGASREMVPKQKDDEEEERGRGGVACGGKARRPLPPSLPHEGAPPLVHLVRPQEGYGLARDFCLCFA